MNLKTLIMDERAMDRAIRRIAQEVLEANEGADDIVLVGIVRRGIYLADRLADAIESIEGARPPVGTLDISFYRDDVTRTINPVRYQTNIPFVIDGRTVVLVDDVLYTGRSVRSALDALMDIGRPKAIQLAIMVDRGHRELPIQANFVGRIVPTSSDEDVHVNLPPIDDRETVEIWG